MTFRVPEKLRLKVPPSSPRYSDPTYGNNGVFRLGPMLIIASDGGGWEHVSVSHPQRTPTWEEMCRVKALFWEAEDCVVQYHPPESDYVNNAGTCLHLWRPIGNALVRPPSIYVGIPRIRNKGVR